MTTTRVLTHGTITDVEAVDVPGLPYRRITVTVRGYEAETGDVDLILNFAEPQLAKLLPTLTEGDHR